VWLINESLHDMFVSGCHQSSYVQIRKGIELKTGLAKVANNYDSRHISKRSDTAVMLYTCIEEVLGSNLGWDTGNPV
jgi:hypothetical protein